MGLWEAQPQGSPCRGTDKTVTTVALLEALEPWNPEPQIEALLKCHRLAHHRSFQAGAAHLPLALYQSPWVSANFPEKEISLKARAAM